jgi:tetraacyldisaccharide 4'-kinase
MQAPEFWWHDTPDWRALALKPLAAIYGAIAAQNIARKGQQASVPVICIGNFVVGGAGKTPTALALCTMLRAMGRNPAFLSRGYGGTLSGNMPLRVDPDAHSSAEVGDEPLLLAKTAPTIICRNRVAGAQAAIDAGADVIVMDDGLQNPSLKKDLSFAIVDAATGIGNGLCLPAGPLRAPMTAQWRAIDAMLIVGEGKPGDTMAHRAYAAGRQTLRAKLLPEPETAAKLLGKNVLAFAGIGRPEKFFATVESCGANIVARRAFADHYAYAAPDYSALRAEAEKAGADLIVTTQKDAVRISADALPDMLALPVTLVFDDPAAIARLVAAKITRA